jgi:purine-binding chemotaxis protein CheW
MEQSKTTEMSIEDVKREAALDIQKKDISQRIQLIIFKLGSEEYALSIDQIKEVVLTPRIAKMPQTHSYIKGVANIRGNIIAILDLEEKFGIERKSDDRQVYHYTLVLENLSFKAGFLVREVPNTLTINSTDIENSATFIQSSSADDSYFQGVVKSGERLIILIDMEKLVESSSINNIVNKAIK